MLHRDNETFVQRDVVRQQNIDPRPLEAPSQARPLIATVI